MKTKHYHIVRHQDICRILFYMMVSSYSMNNNTLSLHQPLWRWRYATYIAWINVDYKRWIWFWISPLTAVCGGLAFHTTFNSLRPSNEHMRQHNLPTLPQIMACRLIGTKPSSDPMLPFYRLDHKEHTSVKSSKFKGFHSRKCTSKCRLWNGGHFVSASMCL